MNNSKNVLFYTYGRGSIYSLASIISTRKKTDKDYCLFFIDCYFIDSPLMAQLPLLKNDLVFYVDTEEEPTTERVNLTYDEIKMSDPYATGLPCAVIGMGGGCTLDTAKSLSNLLTNGGRAEDYQGWDLVKLPGVYKIGIPTLSGTGAETSRTCVLNNKKKKLKLGMNSEYTIFDQLILDPDLSRTVPKNQYFYTGMDTYIHCIESLNGKFRHPVADSFSREALRLCKEVFSSPDMQDDSCREKMMVASYLGGSAIANTYVGIVHPLSAGLSIVLGIHHGLGNCLVMNVMDEFYPDEFREFRSFIDKQKIELPQNITRDLSGEKFQEMYESSIIHEKPLTNALGDGFREILTFDKVIDIFRKI